MSATSPTTKSPAPSPSPSSDSATNVDIAIRVAGLPSLVGFTVVLVSLLALVFPTGSEYAELATVTQPDAYSVAYLEVLTRANPTEAELRLVYTRQLALLGRYDEAIIAVAPVVDKGGVAFAKDPKVAVTARNLLLDLHLGRARAIPEGDPRRTLAMEEVMRQLRGVAELPQTPVRNDALATLALELGEPHLAALLYLKVAAQLPNDSARFFALAARWLRASGENTQAASTYQIAVIAAKSPVEGAEYAVQAIHALEADEKVLGAADLAGQYATQFPTNHHILTEATRLATACSRLADARTFGRRLLATAPDDEVLLRAQIGRELAAADPKAALALLNKLIARHPDDYDARVLRVRTAEWVGDLDAAERDLIWLVAHPKRR